LGGQALPHRVCPAARILGSVPGQCPASADLTGRRQTVMTRHRRARRWAPRLTATRSSGYAGQRAPFQVADLDGDRQRQARFDGDVVGQLGVVDVVFPQGQRLGGGIRQRGGVGVAPGAVGVAPDEPGQPGAAQPPQRVRMGVSGSQEPQRGVQGQVTAEPGVPGRAEQLQVGIQPGQDGAAPLDQAGAQFGGAPQRVRRSQSFRWPQAVGVQQRNSGQHPGVQVVGLGVPGVVLAQVS
jgi:hypothetical protein